MLIQAIKLATGGRGACLWSLICFQIEQVNGGGAERIVWNWLN